MYTTNSVSRNSEIEQQISTSTMQTVVQTELVIRQQALHEQQSQLVKALVSTEGQLKAVLRSTPKGSERADHEQLVERMRESLASLNAQLDATRAELTAIEGQAVQVQYTTTPPPSLIFGMTQQEAQIAGGFVLLFPLVVAFAVRMMKRGSSNAGAPIPPDRFARLESAMETIAVEVERLGESQRFTSKLLNEARPEPQQAVKKADYDRLMRTPV